MTMQAFPDVDAGVESGNIRQKHIPQEYSQLRSKFQTPVNSDSFLYLNVNSVILVVSSSSSPN